MKITEQIEKVTEINLLSLPFKAWPNEAIKIALYLVDKREKKNQFPFSSKEELVQEVEARLSIETDLIKDL